MLDIPKEGKTGKTTKWTMKWMIALLLGRCVRDEGKCALKNPRNIGMILLFALVAYAFCTPAAALNAPAMQAEPQFTRGTSNVVFWTNIPAGTTEVEVCQDANADPADGCLSTQTIAVSGTSGQATFAGTSGSTYSYYVRCKGDNPWSNVVQSTQDDAGPTFSGPSPTFWVKASNPEISVQIADAAGISTSSVSMTLDDQFIPAVYDSSSGSIKATLAGPLSDGSHAIVVTAKDNASAPAGTTSDGSENTFSWSFGVDTAAPQAPTSIQSPGLTSSASPVFGWSGATDTGSGVLGYQVLIIGNVPGFDTFQLSFSPASLGVDPFQWRLPSNMGLSEGFYEIRVQSIDCAGNLSPTYASAEFTVDYGNPSPPNKLTVPPYNAGDNTPGFEWSGASDGLGLAGYQVEILTTTMSVIHSYDLAYSADPFKWSVPDADALPDGQYSIRVCAKDVVGKLSYEREYGFCVDTAPPTTPTVSVPAVMAGNNYEIELHSTDQGSGIVKFLVEVWHEGIRVSQFTMAGSWITPFLADHEGLYEYRAWAVDGAGRISLEYGSDTVVIDTVRPPTPTITPPKSPTANPTPTFIINQPPDIGTTVVYYEICWSGYSRRVYRTAGTFAYEVTDPVYLDGLHEFSIISFDEAGNRSLPARVRIEVDVTPPINSTFTSKTITTADTTPTVTWSASRDSSSTPYEPVAGYKLGIYRDGVIIQDFFAVEGTEWTVPEGVISSDGTYVLKVWAIDDVGRESCIPGECTVLIDRIPPSTPVLGDVSSLTRFTPLYLSWSQATDSGPGVVNYRLEVWSNGVLANTASTTSTHISLVLSEGSNEIRIWSQDGAGNLSTEYARAMVVLDTVAPSPVQDLLVPEVTGDSTPELTWKPPVDQGSGVSAYRIIIKTTDGTLQASYYISPGTVTQVNFVIANALPEGNFTVTVTALDKAGNENTGVTRPIKIDTTPPSPPAAVSGPALTNSLQPVFSWDPVQDATGAAAAYRVELWQSESRVAGPVTVTSPTWTPSLSADGDYQIRVWSVNPTGLLSETYAFKDFGVDTTKPQAPTVTGPTLTTDLSPQFVISAFSDCTGIRVELWKNEICVSGPKVLPVELESTSWEPEAPLSEGIYEIRVWSRDEAGNESDSGCRFVFQVDTVPPMVIIINPLNGAKLDLNSASTLLARSSDAARAQVRLDSGEWVDVTRLNNGLIFHFFTTPLQPGDHTVTLRVWDAAGNMTEVVIHLIVEGQRRGFGFGRFSFPGPTQ